jgi:hypothetical protein
MTGECDDLRGGNNYAMTSAAGMINGENENCA